MYPSTFFSCESAMYCMQYSRSKDSETFKYHFIQGCSITTWTKKGAGYLEMSMQLFNSLKFLKVKWYPEGEGREVKKSPKNCPRSCEQPNTTTVKGNNEYIMGSFMEVCTVVTMCPYMPSLVYTHTIQVDYKHIPTKPLIISVHI